jgi:hypothetical protein
MKHVIGRLAAVMLAGVALVGCVNLKEVREFAGQSAQLSAYPELSQRWASTYDRLDPYLVKGTDAAKRETAIDPERKEAVKDLLRIHETVSLYFSTMAALAGDDTFSVGESLDGLSTQIKASKLTGLDESHVDAYSRIVKIVAGAATSVYQQREVKRYLEEGNAPIQTILTGMRQVTRVYRGTLKGELGTVGFLETVDDSAGQNRIVAMLARAEHARLKTDIDGADKRLQTLDAALEKIKAGHQKLYEDRDRLSSRELRDFVKRTNKDLRTLRKQLKILTEASNV